MSFSHEDCSGMGFCTGCGTQIANELRFCTRCGMSQPPATPEKIASIGPQSDAIAIEPVRVGTIAKTLLKRLPFIVLTYFVSWFLHTFLLAFVNDGFYKTSWCSPYIAVAGNVLSSMAIWGALSALL